MTDFAPIPDFLQRNPDGSRAHPEARPEPATKPARSCLWCGCGFEDADRYRGGPEKKYCSERCRRTVHAKARAWALARFERGQVTRKELEGAQSAARGG